MKSILLTLSNILQTLMELCTKSNNPNVEGVHESGIDFEKVFRIDDKFKVVLCINMNEY